MTEDTIQCASQWLLKFMRIFMLARSSLSANSITFNKLDVIGKGHCLEVQDLMEYYKLNKHWL